MTGNIKFLHIWNLIGACMNYIVGSSCIPTGLNWCDVQAQLQLAGIKVSKPMFEKIKLAERLTLENARKAGENK